MDNHSILIVGFGLIGRSLFQLIPKSNLVFKAHRNVDNNNPNEIYLDLKDLSSFNCPKKISTAYICASITNKKYCEENPEESYIVNVSNTLKLVKILNEQDIFVVFLSSVDVFSGERKKYRIKDKTNATSVYGKFKEEVEKNLDNNLQCSIIRLTKVLSKNTPLISEWKTKLSKGLSVTAFDNVFISPISSSFAAKQIYLIGVKKTPGVFHISGEDDISYFSLLTKIMLNYKNSNKKTKIKAETSNYMPNFSSLSVQEDIEKAQDIDSLIKDII